MIHLGKIAKFLNVHYWVMVAIAHEVGSLPTTTIEVWAYRLQYMGIEWPTDVILPDTLSNVEYQTYRL